MNKKIATLEELFKDFGFVAISKDENGKIYGSDNIPEKDNKCWVYHEGDIELTELFDIPELDDIKWEDSLRYGLIEPTKKNFKNDAKVYVRNALNHEWKEAHLASFEPLNGGGKFFGVWEHGRTSFTCNENSDYIDYYQYCKYAPEELS